MTTNARDKSMDDFPTEVLVVIFDHLNLTSLLHMSRVSKRFRAIAKEAFGKRYSGENDDKFYELKIYADNLFEDKRKNLPLLRTFGENIQAIIITVYDNCKYIRIPMNESHWVYEVLKEFCTSLKKMNIYELNSVNTTRILQQSPSLTHINFTDSNHLNHQWINYTYPNLISATFVGSNQICDDRFKKFLNNNRQLKELCVTLTKNEETNILDLINGKFNELRTMELYSDQVYFDEYVMPDLESITIELPQLESVKLWDQYATVTFLQAICKGCPNIIKLEILRLEEDWNDDATLAVCSLEKLTTLAIDANTIEVEHIRRIVKGLPHLTSLCLDRIKESSEVIEYLPLVVSFCGKLTKLEFTECYWIEKLSLRVDFLASFIDSGLPSQLKITFQWDMKPFQLTISQGQIRLGNSLVYWDGYDYDRAQRQNLLDLDDRCLKLIVSCLDVHSQVALYNTCKKTREIVKDYISAHVFYVEEDYGENIFRTLGDHICKLYTCGRRGDQLRNIHRFCADAVAEITIYQFMHSESMPKLIWPNLKKLTINGHFDYEFMRVLNCPELKHLEIMYNLRESSPKPNHNDQFRHLTTLKVSQYTIYNILFNQFY